MRKGPDSRPSGSDGSDSKQSKESQPMSRAEELGLSEEDQFKAGLRCKTSGRFVKGNKAAMLAKGKRNNYRQMEITDKKLNKRAREIAMDLLEDAMPAVVKHLTGEIKGGNVGAINTALKYGMGNKRQESWLPPGVFSDYANLSPEDRIRKANMLCAESVISIEQADSLIRMAKQEIETEVVTQFRRLGRQLQQKSITTNQALEKIAVMAGDFEEMEATEVNIDG